MPEETANITANPFAAVRQTEKSDEEKKGIWQAAQKLEQMFLNMLLGEMNKTAGRESLLYAGMAEDMFRRELDAAYAERISEGRGVGIAKIFYDQLVQDAPGKAQTPSITPDAALRAAQIGAQFGRINRENAFSAIG